MELDFYHSQPNAEPVTKTPTLVDARVFPTEYGKGQLMTLCEFAGYQDSPDGERRCKHFDQSKYRDCCLWFYDELDCGACGKAGEQ